MAITKSKYQISIRKAIIFKWWIIIKQFHLQRWLRTVHLSSIAGSALRDSRERIDWGFTKRISTLSLRKLSISALSKAVTNVSPKRGTSKFIHEHIRETAPSNVPTAESASQVSAIRETMSVDIIRTSKFNNQLYFFQALPMLEMRKELLQKIFTYDTHEVASHWHI